MSEQLEIGELRAEEIAACGWAGGTTHLRAMAQTRERAGVQYLVVRADAQPVCVGALDFTADPEAGVLMQLCTAPERRSQGLGARLVAEAERRIVAAGRAWARLSVEDDNERARVLYERLGYEAWGRSECSWPTDEGIHHARLIELRKAL